MTADPIPPTNIEAAVQHLAALADPLPPAIGDVVDFAQLDVIHTPEQPREFPMDTASLLERMPDLADIPLPENPGDAVAVPLNMDTDAAPEPVDHDAFVVVIKRSGDNLLAHLIHEHVTGQRVEIIDLTRARQMHLQSNTTRHGRRVLAQTLGKVILSRLTSLK